jgi:hypothetical protein
VAPRLPQHAGDLALVLTPSYRSRHENPVSVEAGELQAYIARRTSEGKTSREAKRALKRIIARQLVRTLTRNPAATNHPPAPLDTT